MPTPQYDPIRDLFESVPIPKVITTDSLYESCDAAKDDLIHLTEAAISSLKYLVHLQTLSIMKVNKAMNFNKKAVALALTEALLDQLKDYEEEISTFPYQSGE